MLFKNSHISVWTISSCNLEHHHSCFPMYFVSLCSENLSTFDDVEDIVQSNLMMLHHVQSNKMMCEDF